MMRKYDKVMLAISGTFFLIGGVAYHHDFPIIIGTQLICTAIILHYLNENKTKQQ
jgi:hypothetical protein